MAFSDAADRVTAIVTVPTDSLTVDVAAANPMAGGASSSLMVIVAADFIPTTAPDGFRRTTWNDWSGSSIVSFTIGMVIVRVVWPGWNVTVPPAGLKSSPGVAVPPSRA